MKKIEADKESVILFAKEEVRPVLQKYESSKATYVYEDFSLQERNDASLLREVINNCRDKTFLKEVLQMQIHPYNFLGMFSSGLERIGLGGLSANLEYVLNDFNKKVLCNDECNYKKLPAGFKVVNVAPVIERKRRIKTKQDQDQYQARKRENVTPTQVPTHKHKAL